MKIVYIADDGTQFDNEYECELYEFKQSIYTGLKQIVMYDENDQVIANSPFDEIAYNTSEKIIIPSQEAADAIRKVADWCGWCCWYSINSPGTWVFENTGDFNDEFVKVDNK